MFAGRGWLAAIGLWMLAGAASAADIHVMSSGAFTAAYRELAPLYEAATGNKVNSAFGASMGNAPDAIPVRLKRGALAALRGYFDAHPDACELLHGPLMDGKRLVATHSTPFWQRHSWGKRARDPRGLVSHGEAFAIPMQEAGVFSCRRAAWPGS